MDSNSNPSSTAQNAKVHQHSLVRRHSLYEVVHGGGAIGKFNTWFAVFITKAVGSMWCAYVFVIISLVSLPAALKSHDPIVIVGWIAQTFLQLVLLPIIIVGQNVEAATSDARAESDHETLIAIHTLTTQVYDISQQQTQILELLESRLGPSQS